MATVWFVVYPAREHPGNAFPANAKIVSAQEGSAAYNAWVGNGAYTVNGVSWQVDAGPFDSKQLAQSWAPKPLSVGDWVTASVAGVMAGLGNVPDPSVSVPAASAIGTGAQNAVNSATAVGDFLAKLQNPHLWQRIAEVFIGGIFLIVAIKDMTAPVTKPVTDTVMKAGKTAAKVGWFA